MWPGLSSVSWKVQDSWATAQHIIIIASKCQKNTKQSYIKVLPSLGLSMKELELD